MTSYHFKLCLPLFAAVLTLVCGQTDTQANKPNTVILFAHAPMVSEIQNHTNTLATQLAVA